MRDHFLRVTYVGGPTALLEFAGLRFLTDPTFDAAGTAYQMASYTLRKPTGPAVPSEALEPVDAVLLSHDHHFDNLDHSGRAFLARAGRVLTTREAQRGSAERRWDWSRGSASTSKVRRAASCT